MNAAERFHFDERTQEILEHLTIPFAIYQYIDKSEKRSTIPPGIRREISICAMPAK